MSNKATTSKEANNDIQVYFDDLKGCFFAFRLSDDVTIGCGRTEQAAWNQAVANYSVIPSKLEVIQWSSANA